MKSYNNHPSDAILARKARKEAKRLLNHKDFIEIPPTAIPWDAVGNGLCRWPCGGNMACGAPSDPSMSYCQKHTTTAWQRRTKKEPTLSGRL